MIEMITEKEMMECIDHIREELLVSKHITHAVTNGEGDMPFQEFRKWVRNNISEWYDNRRIVAE